MDATQSQQDKQIALFFSRIDQDIERSRELRQDLRKMLQVPRQFAPLQEVANG